MKLSVHWLLQLPEGMGDQETRCTPQADPQWGHLINISNKNQCGFPCCWLFNKLIFTENVSSQIIHYIYIKIKRFIKFWNMLEVLFFIQYLSFFFFWHRSKVITQFPSQTLDNWFGGCTQYTQRVMVAGILVFFLRPNGIQDSNFFNNIWFSIFIVSTMSQITEEF